MITGPRIWIPAAALAVAAVLGGGWVVGAQPLLDSASAATQTATTVEANNQATRLRIMTLSKQAAKIDVMQAQDAALQKAVPSILKPNTLIRRINEVAAIDGVVITGIAPSAASAYVPAPSLAGTAAPGSLAVGRTDPAITAANLTYVPVTITATGTYSAVVSFTQDLQDDERLFAVSGLQTAESDGGVVTATISGAVYTLKR